MKMKQKRLQSLLLALVMLLGLLPLTAYADSTKTISISMYAQGWSGGTEVSSASESSHTVLVTFSKEGGSNKPTYYSSGDAVRLYAKNTMTVSASSTISAIAIFFGDGDGNNSISVNTGTFDGTLWSGSAKSVTFTIGGNAGHRRIALLRVVVAAPSHTHSFTYSADGATITATCNSAGCNLTDNKVTLTIVPNPVLYYNDGQPKEASLEGLEAFNAATGKNISTDNIAYYKGDTNVTAQIKVGSGTSIKGATYTARLDVEGKRATVTFKLTAKPTPHTHVFTYNAEGNVITATCTQNASNMEACDLTNKQATLTLNAPLHTTYGDGKDANATLTGEIPGVTNPTIHYSKGGVTLSSAPTDAGTYTAWCQLGNATASVEYTIDKATNSGWTTMPQAKQNLKYTGQPQALITAGTASGGSALYTVGTDPNNEPDDTAGGRPYTSSVPEMTNAGTYYVWCKIDGGKNYTSINAQKVEVTIARADITPSVSIVGWTYGQTANTPMVGDTDNPGNGEVTYTYKVKDAADSTYSATVPTDAGDYTVKAAIAETTNYKGGEATADFTIAQASPTITVPTPAAVTYDPAKTLESVTLPDGWAWVSPTTSVGDAGTKTFKANFTPTSANYNTVQNVDVSVTVSPAKATITTAPEAADDLVYNTLSKPLVKAGAATGGTLMYAVGDTQPEATAFSANIPEGTDAQSYTVWYYAKSNSDNYTDSDVAYLSVTLAAAEKDVLEGGNQTVKESEEPDNIRIDGDPNNLLFVKLDGRELTQGTDYAVMEGSTIISLTPDLIASLSLGTHTLFAQFTDGYAETSITVRSATSPVTGTSEKPLLWLGLMLVSALGLGGVLIANRKRFGVR